MDDESRDALRRLAAEEAGIPDQLRGRVRGDSLGELKADAKRLADELGIAEPQPRGERGQFSAAGDMNTRIRRQAGRAA